PHPRPPVFPYTTLFRSPVAGIEPLAALRADLRAAGSSVLIAADEAVRKATDPLAVAQANAADLIVVKVQPLGGVRRALSIVAASDRKSTRLNSSHVSNS